MKVLRNLMLCVTFFSALALPSVTYAQFKTGGELKEWAEAHDRFVRYVDEPGDAVTAGGYLGYVTAVSEFLTCLPATVNVSQIAAVVLNYLRTHPEQWNNSAHQLVIRALSEAFPSCSEDSLFSP
jgi:hypothetical protein